MAFHRRSLGLPCVGSARNASLLAVVLFMASSAASTMRAESLPPVTLTERPITRELRVGEAHSYLLPLDAGEAGRIVVEQKGIDVLVEVAAPSGQSILTIDLVRPQDGSEEVFLVGDVAGAYRIEIRSSEVEEVSGAYEIRLAARRPATDRDRLAFEAERLTAEANAARLRDTREDMQAARRAFETALGHWQTLGELRWEAQVQNALGVIHDRLGERERAIASYRRAAAVAREAGTLAAEAAATNNLAVALGRRGENREALEQFRRVLALTRERPADDVVCGAESNVGYMLLSLGQPQEASEHLDAALTACRGARNPLLLASVYNNRGRLYRSVGLLDRALDE